MPGKKKKIDLPLQVPKPLEEQAAKQIAFKVPGFAMPLVLLLTAIVYSGALQNGITYIDDDMYLFKNPYLRDFSFGGLKAIFSSFYEFNYHPLTTLTWLVEYKLFGFNPLPYHAFNVLLHLVNTWLAYTLAVRLSGRNITGIVVAVLFALHPMHVESVAWISERKGLLCALFYFLSLLYYLRYTDGGLNKKYYLLSLLLFIAALLSKSAAVTLPVLMVAIDLYRGRKMNAGLMKEKLPFLVLALLFGILAILSQKSGGSFNDISSAYGLVNRVFLFTAGIAFYFVNVVAPFHLSAIHYFPNVDGGVLPWQYYASLPFLIGIVWLVRRTTTLKKEVIFGAFFFLVTISVMLQVITVGSALAAERYTYVSYIGLFYIAGQWIAGVAVHKRFLVSGVFAVVIVVFAVQSWKRIEAWKDTDTILSDIVEKNPGNLNNYLVYYHWGQSKQEQGQLDDALAEYSRAIEINPDYQHAYLKRGEVHDTKGNVIYAIMDFNQAIRVNPRSAMAYNNKGWAYFELGDKILSVTNLDTAIALNGKMATAYNNRGWVHLQAGDTIAAVRDFNSAIREAPAFTKPYYNRALIKSSSGDLKGAIDDYTILIKMNPANGLAYFNRGLSYMKLNNKAAATNNLKKAEELGNKDATEALQYLNR